MYKFINNFYKETFLWFFFRKKSFLAKIKCNLNYFILEKKKLAKIKKIGLYKKNINLYLKKNFKSHYRF